MNTHIHLDDLPTVPLYNIKAVVQATDISSSTLRAWERRYNMCTPQRSESGYRLYSERDIAIIRWLKAQVDAGMSISQAVAWLDQLAGEAGGQEHVVLPVSGELSARSGIGTPQRQSVRQLATLQDELLDALLHYDEQTAEHIVAEAFSLYPVEQVGEELFAPVLVEIGERWHSGRVSITAEHYATQYLLRQLMALLRASTGTAKGPLIWVGCAPGELHEIGALLLSIYLRRAGYHVHYLGSNLPVHDLVQEVKQQMPAMVLFSASSSEAANGLAQATAHLVGLESPRPIVGYGGRIFNQHPERRSAIAGVFLGHTAQDAVEIIADLLQESVRAERQHSL